MPKRVAKIQSISTASISDPIPAPAPAPAPSTANHHQALITLLQILLHLAPAIASPFLKNPVTSGIVTQELSAATTLVDALSTTAGATNL